MSGNGLSGRCTFLLGVIVVTAQVQSVAFAQIAGITVTDGSTTVTSARTLRFTSGCTVSGTGTTTASAACSGGGGGGTVTSVGLSLPASTFSVTGSPVTGSGTLTGDFISQAQNTVFAGPTGSSGTPTWRLLVASDIPSLSSTYLPLAGGTMTGSIVIADLGAAIDSGAYAFQLRSGLPDSGSTTAFVLDTTNPLTTGRYLLALRNDGTDKLLIDWDGNLTLGRSSNPGDNGVYRYIRTEASAGTDQQGTALVIAGGNGGPGNGAGGTVIISGGKPTGSGDWGGIDIGYGGNASEYGTHRIYMGGSRVNANGGDFFWYGRSQTPLYWAYGLGADVAAVTVDVGSAGQAGGRMEVLGGAGGVGDVSNNGGPGGDGVVKGGTGGAGTASRPGGNGGAAYLIGGSPGANNGGGQGGYGPAYVDGANIYIGTGGGGPSAATSIVIGSNTSTTTINGLFSAANPGLFTRLDQPGLVSFSLGATDAYAYMVGNVTAHAVTIPDPTTLNLGTGKTKCYTFVCDATCGSYVTYIYALPYGVTKINGTVTQNSGTGARMLQEAYASVTMCTDGTANYFATVITNTAFAINP